MYDAYITHTHTHRSEMFELCSYERRSKRNFSASLRGSRRHEPTRVCVCVWRESFLINSTVQALHVHTGVCSRICLIDTNFSAFEYKLI